MSLELLQAAVAGLRSAPCPDGDELLVQTAELLGLQQQLRVLVADRLGLLDRSGFQELTGERSTFTWARALAPDLPRGDLEAGLRMQRWPRLREAALDGRTDLRGTLTVGQALETAAPLLDWPDGLVDGVDGDAVLAAVCGNTVPLVAQACLGLDDSEVAELDARVEGLLQQPRQRDRFEAALVLLAERVPYGLLADCVQQQLEALVPSRLEQSAERARRERYLRLTPVPGGGVRVTGRLDTPTSELLHACLSAAARRDPANATDTAALRELREDRGTAAEPRGRGQRRHDALARVLEHYRDSGGLGSHDKQPVRVTVTVTEGLLAGRAGTLPAVGAGGQHIAPSLLRRWWCDGAEVTALLLNRAWRALGDTHTQRTLTRRERRAVVVEHAGRCAGDGCCDPVDPLTRLEPHHVQRWSQTGSTSIRETVLACDRLHHDLHHGRTVRLRSGRWLTELGYVDEPVGSARRDSRAGPRAA